MYRDPSTAKRERDTVSISYSPLLSQVLVDTFGEIHSWYEESQTHEEADTLICHPLLASISNSANQKLCIRSLDTDVLLLLIDLVSYGHVSAPSV